MSRATRAAAWLAGGVVFTFLQMWLVAGLVGAGHGVGTPAHIAGAPFGYFFFVWPLVFGLAGLGWRSTGWMAALILVVHYVGVAFVPDVLAHIGNDLQRDSVRDFYVAWMLLYLLANAVLIGRIVVSSRGRARRVNDAV